MAEPTEVAEWMTTQFKRNYLYQEEVVYAIKKKFGEPHIYANERGNFAISKPVLKEFRKLTEGIVVWERGSKAWRSLTDKEKANYTGRQDD